jgi:hypothetical protein
MSVDERLRIGLSRNAQSYDPDVEVLLQSALSRRRRARWLRRAGATAALVAAACAATVLAMPGGWWADRGWPLEPEDGTTSSLALQGRFAGEVDVVPAAPGVAGPWVLDFKAEGVLSVTAPPSYPGVVSGAIYAVEGDQMRIDLFGQDLCTGRPPGRYAVTRTGAELTLLAVDDLCPARVTVLSTTRWSSEP